MGLSEQTKIIQTFIQNNPEIDNLKDKELSGFYVDLVDCIVDHNHLYYIEHSPILSDKEYDELFDYLKKIEEHSPNLISSNSPTQGLVGQISEGFKQANHKVKLLSLENSYDAEDLKAFDERVYKNIEVESDVTYEIEPKFDGLSVELVYENGNFKRAVTRGDGQTGDDVTINVSTIKNVPKKLKVKDGEIKELSVRGEIMMPKSVWKEINKEREVSGLIPFANTRNAASGSLKLLDSGEVAKRNLVCFVYDILYVEGDVKLDEFKSQADVLGWMGKIGLPVFDWHENCKNIDEAINICLDTKTKEHLESQDIDFDGLVIKVQDEGYRKALGTTEHHPKRAIAYKFPAQLVATQINSVDFQVGRTGIITPVANLQEVELSGVKIRRVSLHNFDFIKSKDLRLHDWVWLQRSGEVIPYIVSSITDRRGDDVEPILPPSKCPSCGENLVNEDIHYYCHNLYCPAQVKEKIVHFVSKNCMDIEGMGESTIDLFVDRGLLKDVSDIYKIEDQKAIIEISKYPGFGDKKINELVKQIGESKHKSLWRLLNGLGIDGVGKKTAQDILRKINGEKLNVKDVNEFKKVLTDQEFLVSIYGVGEKIIEGIVGFIDQNQTLLDRLQESGVNFDSSKYNDGLIDEENVKGSFSITGTFPVTREKIVEMMQKNGYIWHESPTKNTNMMLVGDGAGSKKTKAENMGIEIFEGWDNLTKKFDFLKNISVDVKPKIQSLFG